MRLFAELLSLLVHFHNFFFSPPFGVCKLQLIFTLMALISVV